MNSNLVIGIGGYGLNIAKTFMKVGDPFDLVGMDADIQALSKCPAPTKIQMGSKLLKGLGTNRNVENGYQAAAEVDAGIRTVISGYNRIFVCVGAAGGASGAAAYVLKLAKDLGIQTIVLTVLPYGFEGPGAKQKSEDNLKTFKALSNYTYSFLNDELKTFLTQTDQKVSLSKGFDLIDELMYRIVIDITNIDSFNEGIVNEIFASNGLQLLA